MLPLQRILQQLHRCGRSQWVRQEQLANRKPRRQGFPSHLFLQGIWKNSNRQSQVRGRDGHCESWNRFNMGTFLLHFPCEEFTFGWHFYEGKLNAIVWWDINPSPTPVFHTSNKSLCNTRKWHVLAVVTFCLHLSLPQHLSASFCQVRSSIRKIFASEIWQRGPTSRRWLFSLSRKIFKLSPVWHPKIEVPKNR